MPVHRNQVIIMWVARRLPLTWIKVGQLSFCPPLVLLSLCSTMKLRNRARNPLRILAADVLDSAFLCCCFFGLMVYGSSSLIFSWFSWFMASACVTTGIPPKKEKRECVNATLLVKKAQKEKTSQTAVNDVSPVVSCNYAFYVFTPLLCLMSLFVSCTCFQSIYSSQSDSLLTSFISQCRSSQYASRPLCANPGYPTP